MTTPKPQPQQLIQCMLDQLELHPRNMRRTYPPEQVARMADSMTARIAHGQYPVIHPLVIVPNQHPNHYFVEDGNLRLVAARTIPNCPPLDCLLVADTPAQQLTAMIATTVRFNPDPVSEAMHYRRLMDEEHYTVARIAKETGRSTEHIYRTLRLLDLDLPIQDLLAQGRLPRDARAVEALLSIPDATVRVKLALRLARDGVGIRAIVGACARLVEMLKEKEAECDKAPAVTLSERQARRKEPPTQATWDTVRTTAFHVCAGCEIKAARLATVAEPAWETITHSATDVCNACNVQRVRDACNVCPVVDLLRRLIENVTAGAAP